MGVVCGVLVDCDECWYVVVVLVFGVYCVVGVFGGDYEYVEVFVGFDQVEVDVEVVGEEECCFFFYVVLKIVVVDVGLQFVGGQYYDYVGLFGGFGYFYDFEVGFFGFGGGG